ncbi:hypothetical protein LZ30DRAFT_356435 [Colletotrichum cereale]|nr:hypothetical protein LZ30DRAFT_356435 [Colletotrichum cereale]
MGSSRSLRAKFFQRHSMAEKMSMKSIKLARKARYDDSKALAAALGRSKPKPNANAPNKTAKSRTVDNPQPRQERTDIAVKPTPMDVGVSTIKQVSVATTHKDTVRNKPRRNSVSALSLPTRSSSEAAPKPAKARRNTTVGHASGDKDALERFSGLRRSARPAAAVANANIKTLAYANGVMPNGGLSQEKDRNILPSVEDGPSRADPRPCRAEIIEVPDSEADDDDLRPSTAGSNGSDASLVVLPPQKTDQVIN